MKFLPKRTLEMIKIVLVIFCGIFSQMSFADCYPEKMIKIKYHETTPSIDPDSWLRKPKILYRFGKKYGRMEEIFNPETGIHGLIVVSEPDIWIANLADKSGQHILDTGRPIFHAPVLFSDQIPEIFRDLEFGCEKIFIDENIKGKPVPDKYEGREVTRYEINVKKYKLVFLMGKMDQKPKSITFFEDSEILVSYRYVIFKDDLEPNFALFEAPKGIDFVEAE